MNDHTKAPTTTPGQCAATTVAGRPCKAKAYKGQWCAFHDPENAKAIAAGRAKGAKNLWDRLRREDLTSLDLSNSGGIEEGLVKLAYALAQKRIDGSDARTLTAILSKLCEVRDLRAIEAKLDEE